MDPYNTKDNTKLSRKRKKAASLGSTSSNNNSLSSVSLRILIGSVEQVDHVLQLNDDTTSSKDSKPAKLRNLIQNYNLSLVCETLPGRPAKSRSELNEWNSRNGGNGWWPSLFFEKQTLDFKEKELALDLDEEWGMMRDGMLAAFKDSRRFPKNEGCGTDNIGCGAVIVCPRTQKIVATAFDEWYAQAYSKYLVLGKDDSGIEEDDMKIMRMMSNNPLSTPVLLAIQGVSRRERAKAVGHGMDSNLFKNGQYLCTGYDIYVTKEPGIFEAMALVHSRIRRVVFYEDNKTDGGLGGTGSKTAVHCLPGTNHHYRVFRYRSRFSDDLFK